MAFFTPHEHDHQIPAIASSIERAVVDWKSVAPPTEFKKASDAAAFANHLGGTLLIGATERETNGHPDGQLGGYRWHTDAEAGTIRDEFSKAIRSRCLPLPQFDFVKWRSGRTRTLVAYSKLDNRIAILQ